MTEGMARQAIPSVMKRLPPIRIIQRVSYSLNIHIPLYRKSYHSLFTVFITVSPGAPLGNIDLVAPAVVVILPTAGT